MAKRSRKPETRGVSRRGGLAVASAAAVVVAAVVGWFAYRAVADLPGVRLPDQGNLHVATETSPHEPYNSDPPTSGPHLPHIAPWGVHTRPIPRELQVHNLEDGGVVVQYSCDCPDVVEKLGAIVRRYDRQVILAPYPGMASRIALTAWTRIDTMNELDEARVVRFVETYRGIDHHR
ncbi:MAG: hypothetical protein A3I17_09935 [Candidatus Rokubacteria bacterium RIFCSPLOWO2_02_FULL_72_37]|nr:MAG: hypothetical protein A3I17_09935 [Candidatus Rokubacteria bacterium RIFCSPLOWO2_02_FULL_72_37]